MDFFGLEVNFFNATINGILKDTRDGSERLKEAKKKNIETETVHPNVAQIQRFSALPD